MSLFVFSSVLNKALFLRSSVNLVAGIVFATSVFAQSEKVADKPADKAVVRIDDGVLTEADLAIAAEDPALSLPGLNDEQKRDLLIGYLTDLKIGAKAAEAAKVSESPDFARRMAYFRDKVLLDEYLSREGKAAVTPEASQKLYEETIKGQKPETEMKARHILVETEAEAKAIKVRLDKGEDFAKIAGEVSKDPGSKAEGGDLGFFTKDRMVAPFSEAALKLNVGQVSEPVKTQFGYHLIKLEDKRERPVPAFSEMKQQIEAYLARKAQQDIILVLRQKSKIERLDTPKASEAKPQDVKPADVKPIDKK